MLRRRSILIIAAVVTLLALAFPASAQEGVRVTCPSGQVIENGVEVVVNMRPGFTYTATAVGLDGFDPVLAVTDASGAVLCNDDDSAAATYSASLPTAGFVPVSSWSSQMPFTHNYSDFADISIIVGGFNNTAGEFILIFEGMAVTAADGSGPSAGDPFSLHVTPNVIASGVPVTAYMISVTDALDPLMVVMGSENQPFQFSDGTYLACDDAGSTELCWGASQPLGTSYVSRTQERQLPGGTYDAMMTLTADLLDPDTYITWHMTSYNQETTGDYIVVFHLGTSGAGGQAVQPPAQTVEGAVRQWAVSATSTSQYGDPGWGAIQATGAPDTGQCGDLQTAWASASSTGVDSLTLTYAQAVLPTHIYIYETYNPGSIIGVEVAYAAEGFSIEIPASNDPPGNTVCPGIFSLDIGWINMPVDTVTIYLDQSIGGSWNEIDAVELVGDLWRG